METMIKLRFRYAFGVSTPFAKAPPRIGTHLSIRSSVSLPSHSSSSTLKVPLFLRPPIHSATASDLRKWSDWATRLASSVGTSFADSDGGPDSALLRRELRWLLEDAVESEDESTGVARLRTSVEDLYSAWKQRVGERRPFQYVVGCEHWRDLVLCVGEGVLIPRPETEAMVELVGEAVEADARLRDGGVWADLGTGSGAIAIGMARVLKGRGRVLATDLSPQALSVARYNVQRYALQDVIELRQGSWFEPLEGMEGRVAVIVSNPPYIPSSDISRLQAEVGRHEPVMALDGGVDGLDDLILLCKGTSSMLKPAGFFAFETNGEKQCKHLVEYMETETTDCFRDVKIVSDFAGIPRFVTGFRQ